MAKSKKAKPKSVKKTGRSLTAEQQSRLAAWLGSVASDPDRAWTELEELAAQEADLAEAMVAGLGGLDCPAAADLAARSGETETKALRKAARKAAYQLAQKGLNPTEPAPPKQTWTLKRQPVGPPKGLATGYYPDGRQLVFFYLPQAGQEAWGGVALCHFAQGMTELMLERMSRTRFKAMVQDHLDQAPWAPAELEGDDLVWLIKRMLARRRPDGLASASVDPADRVSLARWLADWDHVDPDKPAPMSARAGDQVGEVDPAELLSKPPCSMWPPLEELEQMDDQDAGLILNPEQQADMDRRRRSRQADRIYPAADRPGWRERLIDTAAFHQAGGEPGLARAALDAAEDVDSFLTDLVALGWSILEEHRQLMAQEQDQPAETETEGGLIIPGGIIS